MFLMPLFLGSNETKREKKTNISKIMRTEIYNWSLILIKLEETRTPNEIAFTLKLKTASDLKTRKGTYNWNFFFGENHWKWLQNWLMFNTLNTDNS